MGQAGPSFGQVPFRERGRWSSAPSDCRAAALGQADGRRPCPVGRAVGWREATGWRSTQGYSEQQFSDFSEAGRRAYRPRHQRHRPQPRKGVKRRELHICVLRRDGLSFFQVRVIHEGFCRIDEMPEGRVGLWPNSCPRRCERGLDQLHVERPPEIRV